MQSAFSPPGATAEAGRDPYLTRGDAKLRPGDRFPNFLLPDQEGGFQWFVQYGHGRGQLVMLDPAPEMAETMAALASDYAAADLECIGIALAAPASPGFPVLVDSAGKIGPALRQMSGLAPQGTAAFLLDRNQRLLAIGVEGDLLRWGLQTWIASRRAEPADIIEQLAPVLTVPNVLSPDQCKALMERWQTHGHEEGKVTSLVKGEQVRRVYEALKRRTDHRISDPAVAMPLLRLIARRLGPELEKAFHYKNFQFDRVYVACYDAARGDYFRRHRDNRTPATATRRFALTLNLNSDEYEGGELIFPEFGAFRYKVPAGGAIVFSCSLLHEALPVTRGRRFALLTFLRDAGASAGPEGADESD